MANILRTLSAPQMASVYCRPSVSRATMYNSKSWKMASSGLLSRVIEARGAFQVSVCFSQRRSFASDADIPPQRPKMLPEFDLTGKICIVSGAAQGLGLTQAEALLEAGATVYALDRRNHPSPTFSAIANRAALDLGAELHYRQVDVRDNIALNGIIEDIANAHNRLDGLIAAAGIQQEMPALEYTQEDANLIFETNVTGVFMTAQACAKQMIRFGNGGSMVFIGSMSGQVANRGLLCPAYNASKAAVLQLGRGLAAEWGELGIRVNTISPGYIVTPMVEALFVQHPERRGKWPKENMLGRLSYARDYRGAAVFLISDASSFMTAADLRIDGGHAAW